MGFLERLAEKLEALRESRAAFVTAAGVNPSTINSWLSRNGPGVEKTIEMAVKLARSLGTTVEALYDGMEPQPRELQVASPEQRQIIDYVLSLSEKETDKLLGALEIVKMRLGLPDQQTKSVPNSEKELAGGQRGPRF